MIDIYGRLNARQMEVLRWICDGCPGGVMVGFTYKATAIALQNRRLVTVSRKRGQWRAEVTDAGRYYLEHAHHPHRPASTAKHGHSVPSASAALAAVKEQESAAPCEGRGIRARSQGPKATCASGAAGSNGGADRRGVAVRYRVVVSRVQVAERYIRAVDDQDAVRKVQEELDRPYGFIGGWRTVDTDLDVAEAESPLQKAPGPLDEHGSMLLPLKQAAAHLGISYSSLWHLVHGGEIDHVEIGNRRYISRDGLKAFIETNTRRGTAYRP